MRTWMLATLAAILTIPAAVPCRADVITLKGGRTLVGTIRERDADPLRIVTQFGEESVSRASVESVSFGPTPWDQFEERMGKTDAKSLSELDALLEWAEEADRAPHLRGQLKRLYRMLLRLDPDHEKARKGLNYIKVEGEWVSRDEARRRQQSEEALKAEEEAKKRAEEERLALLRRAEGDVGLQMEMTKERDQRDSEVLGRALGVEITKATSKRVSVAGHFDREGAKPLLELGEHALTTVGVELGEGEGFNPGRAGARGVFHQFFVKPPQRKAMIDFFRSSLGGISDAFYAHLMRGGESGISCSAAHPYAMAVDRQGLDRADHMLHQIGHCVVGSLSAGQGVPAWLQEGYGMYMSIRFTGNTQTWCTTLTRYAHEIDVAKKSDSATWALLAREQVSKNNVPRFHALCDKHLNKLDARDLARSWVICKFLMEKHPRSFRNFLRYSGEKRESQERALQAALEWTFDRLDEEVDKYVMGDMK